MIRISEICRSALEWALRYPLRRSQWIVLAVCLLLLAIGMIEFGDRIAIATNTDSESYDQGAYLRVAERNRDAFWPTVTDGIRNPLFPWLLAKTSTLEADTMFSAGLRLNVRLGALFVFALGLWAGRRFAWLPAVTFAIIASAVVLPISTYVGTEVLFYAFFFIAWMLAFALYERLTWLKCALFGVALGFAYLAKPAVTLLTGCFVIVGVGVWLRMRGREDALGWNGIRPFFGALLAVGVFALMILPRAFNAWEQFRDPLQNTAARCLWAANWDECYPILGYLNPRFIERIPPDDRPSASRYVKRYGWPGAWTRIAGGVAIQADNVFAPDQKNIWFDRRPSAKRPVRRIFPYRGFLLLPPAALLGGLLVFARKDSKIGPISPTARYQFVFGLMVVILSFAAFSWYSVIAPGARFIIALYLPILASMLLAVESLRRQLDNRVCDYVVAGTWSLMFAAVTIHLALICTHPYFDKLKGAF